MNAPLRHRFARVRRGVRIGHRVRPRLIGIVRTFAFEVQFAVAAIAAGGAFLAQMVGARVFGASDTDACRLFFANTADKGHGGSH